MKNRINRFAKREPQSRGLSIIIVGCGKVGSSIVERLINENHNISVIDLNASRIEQITDTYDVLGVVGNAASYSVQMEAGVDQADIFIAVTGSDELNMLCCVVAKRTGHCDVIARIRRPEYSEEADYLKEKLGLTMMINPDLEAAKAISRILYMPTVQNVDSFAGGQAEMIRIKLPKDNLLDGKRIMDLDRNLMANVLICAVERGGDVVIPGGTFVLQAGDVVTFITPKRLGRSFLQAIGFQFHAVRDTILIGGGISAYYLAKLLLEIGIEVRIVEKRPERCEELSVLLPRAVVINGDASNAEFLNEIGIETAQSIVTMTGMDEENVILTLHAQEVSNAKLITKINRINFHRVLEKLDLGSVVYPKYIASEAIIAFVREKAASMNSDIETLVQMFRDRAEAVEFLIGKNTRVTNIPLMDLPLKDQTLVTCINRKGKIIIPRGGDVILPGDTVIIVTTHTGIQSIDDILK